MLSGMDPISQFQQQLGAPVYALLGVFWLVVLFAALAIVGFFVLPARMKADHAPFDLSLDGDSDGSGDSGGDD